MKRALIYAHYDRDGVVDDHVLHALRAHRETADQVIFVSTAALDERQQQRAGQYADQILVRDNVGIDFMSWKQGLALLKDVEAYDELVFSNDSIYGPLSPLADVYERARSIEADLWGLCINHQFSRHVQSYFFVFRQSLIRSGVMAEFWDGVRPLADKMTAVRAYEIGLSRFVEERGYSIGALFEPHWLSPLEKLRLIMSDISPRAPLRSLKFTSRVMRTKTMNPNHELWHHMIEAGVPFIKVELLRDNPHDVGLDRTCRYVGGKAPYYDVGAMRDHSLRTRADR